MAKFRKKPVVIEAWRNMFDSVPPDWLHEAVQHPGSVVKIQTLEGIMLADEGDWIIKGIKGEVYPCKPDIFDATYEPVGG
jgi:hypothetical protein